MLLVEAIQDATTKAGIKHLSYANLQEFNAFKNSFTFLEYPVNVVVPYRETDSYNGNRNVISVVLQGWVLTRIKEDTNDWRSLKLEELYIGPMRQMARKFIISLINSEVISIDAQTPVITFTIQPEYMFLDAHLFGVSYSVSIPVMGGVC